MWDLIVSVPDHCLSFYFTWHRKRSRKTGTGSQPVPETFTVDILAADQKDSETATICGDSNLTVSVVQPQDTMVQLDHPLLPKETITCAIRSHCKRNCLGLTLCVPALN